MGLWVGGFCGTQALKGNHHLVDYDGLLADKNYHTCTMWQLQLAADLDQAAAGDMDPLGNVTDQLGTCASHGQVCDTREAISIWSMWCCKCSQGPVFCFRWTAPSLEFCVFRHSN
jgi:hypothetical protein